VTSKVYFDGPRGLFVAQGPPLVVGSGLGEDAAEFDLAAVGTPVRSFPRRPSVSLATIGRPGAIDLLKKLKE
jgi:hypothetical protein